MFLGRPMTLTLPPHHDAVKCPDDIMYEALHGPIRTESAPAFLFRTSHHCSHSGFTGLTPVDIREMRSEAVNIPGSVSDQARVLIEKSHWMGLSLQSVKAILTRETWAWVK